MARKDNGSKKPASERVIHNRRPLQTHVHAPGLKPGHHTKLGVVQAQRSTA